LGDTWAGSDVGAGPDLSGGEALDECGGLSGDPGVFRGGLVAVDVGDGAQHGVGVTGRGVELVGERGRVHHVGSFTGLGYEGNELTN
jgi:hypothetical protein